MNCAHLANEFALPISHATAMEIARVLDAASAVEVARQSAAAFQPYERTRLARRAYAAVRDAEQAIARTRRAAMNSFARERGWKYEGEFGVSELHDEALSRTWCETCGGLCRAHDHYIEARHTRGKSTSFVARRSRYAGRTVAVVQHSCHPFERCVEFAALFRLGVVQLEWSWYGLPTAALFTRGAP